MPLEGAVITTAYYGGTCKNVPPFFLAQADSKDVRCVFDNTFGSLRDRCQTASGKHK